MAAKKLDAAGSGVIKAVGNMTGEAGGKMQRTAQDNTGEERVDQIRDILFGAQRQEYERKFTRLEELLVKNINDLNSEITEKINDFRNEYDRRLNQLEELLVKNISILSTTFDKNLNAQKKELKDFVDKSIAGLNSDFTDRLNINQTSNDDRFIQLKELLASNIADLGTQYERKLNAQKKEQDQTLLALESLLHKSVTELKEDIQKQFDLQKNEFNQKLATTEENLAGAVADFNRGMHNSSNEFFHEISKAKAEIITSLNKIDAAKVDSRVLAAFLHEIASGLESKKTKSTTEMK